MARAGESPQDPGPRRGHEAASIVSRTAVPRQRVPLLTQRPGTQSWPLRWPPGSAAATTRQTARCVPSGGPARHLHPGVKRVAVSRCALPSQCNEPGPTTRNERDPLHEHQPQDISPPHYHPNTCSEALPHNSAYEQRKPIVHQIWLDHAMVRP